MDLHLRVPADAFDRTSAALRSIYSVVHSEIWQRAFATFEVAHAEPPTGIALRPSDGERNRLFRRPWQLLTNDPRSLPAYNEMKRLHQGGSAEAYRAAKSAFFAWLTGEPGARGHA